MALDPSVLDELAGRLDEAARTATATAQLTQAHPTLSLDEGYAIQRRAFARRLARGEGRAGMKMGLTSRAKMEQVGVHEPIYGHLSGAMRLVDGGELSLDGHIHARAEPEVAFLLGRDLSGPVSPAEALAAVEGVCAAIEIIDSRYENFRFTLEDVVADNASSSRFVLGSTLKAPGDVELGNLGMVLEEDGVAVQVGSSAAILEHPARSLATLSALLAPSGEGLQAGDVVLAGGATAAIPLAPGRHVRVRVDGLGSAELFVAAAS